MVLIDGRIHGGVSHWASSAMLEKINSEPFKTIWKDLVSEVGYAD